MSSHYIAVDKGANVLKADSFTVGTSATTHVFEFRILDGAAVKHIDMQVAIEAIENYLQNEMLVAAGGFDVTT